MALAGAVTGEGNLISYEPLVREYFVTFFGLVSKYRETTTTEIREWYALTKTAAIAGAGAEQPEDGTYTFQVSEQDRVTQAFSLSRTHIVTSTERVT